MNQILEFGTEKNGKTPHNNGGGSSSSDKVIKVFALLLMIIAIALIASGAYSLFKNKETSESNASVPTQKVQAIIEAVQDEENGKVNISVTSEITISRLIYNWDQGTEKVISGENSLTMEESIDLPAGEHVLTIKVIDTENNETLEKFTFEAETGIDTTPPEITLDIVTVDDQKKLLITATDDTEIAYITYMWNEEEQITVEAEEEGQTEIQVQLDIPRGKNTINVIAVDASESSNTKSATKSLDGRTKPEVSFNLSADSSVLEVVCTHESGIKSIFYTFEGQDYEANFDDDNISTYVSFTQASVEGKNEMVLKVTSVDDTVTEYDNLNWTYYPNGVPETTTEETEEAQ
jgi:hypothetical protein